MSSPVSELLAQERDLFKTISASVDAASNASSEINSPLIFSDNIAQLLDQMVQILPPEERNIFGNGEEKNIEEIIQEANELIRSTSPLFSSSNSYDRSLKGNPFIQEHNTKEPPNRPSEIVEDASENASSCSSLESIPVDNPIVSYLPLHDNTVESKLEIPAEQVSSKDSDKSAQNPVVAESLYYDEIPASPLLRILKQPPNTTLAMIEPSIDSSGKIANYDQSVPENLNNKYDSVRLTTATNVFIDHKAPDLNSESIEQKYQAQVAALKSSHNKVVEQLTEQIYQLNKKASMSPNTPARENNKLERLEGELKTQEQLLIGYEQENRRLCQEMSSLKENWRDKEMKLMEDKQKLKKEMKDKVSTEALEEELKDSRETIVKLQMELARFKSRNKELETSCKQLQEERLRLQTELSQCQCDRTPGRIDKYSFLASSNVGTQINQLKAVITRKDVEIAQMAGTIEMLKAQMSNRGGATPGVLESKQHLLLAEQDEATKAVAKEKEGLLKENIDLKRQVRELETIVKRRQRSDLYFPDAQTQSRLVELEKELSSRQEALTTLHSQFINMQKKYEKHIQDLEDRLKEAREELLTLKSNQRKEQFSNKTNAKKAKPVIKEETHLLATIRGLRQEAANRDKEMNKLNKELEEVRQTNRKLQKEREKQLNCIPNKIPTGRDKPAVRKVDKPHTTPELQANLLNPNNNMNLSLLAELQDENFVLKSKTKCLQEEVKRLEQDLILMHNKRVHDLNLLQNEHETEVMRLVEERAAFLSEGSNAELQGQLYTQQMVINHLKNRLKQMEELKNEVTLLRAERDHLEENLSAVNNKLCFLQNAQSPESIQYKTLLEKLETLEKNQEIREQKLNSVRELLSHSTQGQSQAKCGGTCRDKLLDKNRQICFYRAQMDRILESLLDIRRTK